MKGASSAKGAIVSDEELRDLGPRLVGGDGEDRAREAHRQGGVGADVDEVELDEPRQPALPGTLGPGEGAGPLGSGASAPPGNPGPADGAAAHHPERLSRTGADAVGVGCRAAPSRGVGVLAGACGSVGSTGCSGSVGSSRALIPAASS